MKISRNNLNPVLTADNFVSPSDDLQAVLAFNPGVTEYQGKVVLLVRVALQAKPKDNLIGVPIYNSTTGTFAIKYFDKNDTSCDFSDVRVVKQNGVTYLTTLSCLYKATSADYVHFDVDDKPFIVGERSYESYGVEDARITKLGKYYYINYSGVSQDGIVTVLARTRNFLSVEKLGVVFLPDNKDVVIFPARINGKFVALSRPESAYFRRPNVWISTSKDLRCWGNHKLLLSLREGKFDSARLGASCVPFATDKGWLAIYHGATEDNRYCLGALLADKRNPSKIIARTDNAIMFPQEKYETDGFMPNVIFACGCLVKDNTVHLYYGACDQSVCYATFSVHELLQELNDNRI